MRLQATYAVFAAALLFGCKSDDVDKNDLLESEVSIKKGESYQIKLPTYDGVEFVSENDFHALVDNRGRVTGNYAGSTTVRVLGVDLDKHLKVTVEPRFTLFEDPYLEFGKTKEEVIAAVGTPTEDGGAIIRYYSETGVTPLIIYSFNDSLKLTLVGVHIPASYIDDLERHIDERFKLEEVYEPNNFKGYRNALEVDDATIFLDKSPFMGNDVILIYSLYTEERKIRIKEKESKGE